MWLLVQLQVFLFIIKVASVRTKVLLTHERKQDVDTTASVSSVHKTIAPPSGIVWAKQ